MCQVVHLNNVEVIEAQINDLSIFSIYKPPNSSWPLNFNPNISQKIVLIGDFNAHHTAWGYPRCTEDGEHLLEWAEHLKLHLLFDAKERGSFHSARWNKDSNPDLCFVSSDQDSLPIPSTRNILSDFPNSQHRPVLVHLGIQIRLFDSINKPRWNFNKANWSNFSKSVDSVIRWIPPNAKSYMRFVGVIIGAAKRNIPRGFRKEYIPGWSQNCMDLYKTYLQSQDPRIGNQLLLSLNEARKKRWMDETTNINFTHSSRKGWALLRRLGAAAPATRHGSTMDPNLVAGRLQQVSKAVPLDKNFAKQIDRELKNLKKSNIPTSLNLSTHFELAELTSAIAKTKCRKAPGEDNIHPEFLKHLGPRALKWLLDLYNNMLDSGFVPSKLKFTKVVAILKPGKPESDRSSYRPIALLSVLYKVLERMIYNRIYPIIDDVLPAEQAGFRQGRSCADQVLSLTTFIEAGFQDRLKTCAAFIDLTAAYDTVWKKGLLVKLLRIIPFQNLTRLIGSLISDRCFKVHIGSAVSKTKKLNNGLPQGSVLAPILFNLYISDLPATTSRKFGYADDLALATQEAILETGSAILTRDLNTLSDYFRKWRLCPNPAKTVVSSFHLNNKLANETLNVNFGRIQVQHDMFPKYLGVTLDRTLSFKNHLEKLRQKLKTRNNIIRKLSGTTWGADAQTLRIAALAFVYSTAEYCAPIWRNSAHTNIVDAQLNECMRIISGTLRSTPTAWLPVLCSIYPPVIRRKLAAVHLWSSIETLSSQQPLAILQDVEGRTVSRLKSRHLNWIDRSEPFNPEDAWKSMWCANLPANGTFVEDPSAGLPGLSLPRKTWCSLNRLRTGHAKTKHMLHKWGLTQCSLCDCGEDVQTVKHIFESCPLRKYRGSFSEVFQPTSAVLDWANNLDLDL